VTERTKERRQNGQKEADGMTKERRQIALQTRGDGTKITKERRGNNEREEKK